MGAAVPAGLLIAVEFAAYAAGAAVLSLLFVGARNKNAPEIGAFDRGLLRF